MEWKQNKDKLMLHHPSKMYQKLKKASPVWGFQLKIARNSFCHSSMFNAWKFEDMWKLIRAYKAFPNEFLNI